MNAIVDIDQILWDFNAVLAPKMTARYPHVKREQIESDYYWFKTYNVPVEDFYKAVKDVHSCQNQYKPFPEARSLLMLLRQKGYKVIVASHREKESYYQTISWFAINKLPFDDMYLSYNKRVLYDKDCGLVVDDSPNNIKSAIEKNIPCVSIKYPYNSHFSECSLHSSLSGVIDYIGGVM